MGRPKSDDEPSLVDDRREITGAMLREVLHYDPETGIFRWAANRGYKNCAGTMAGCMFRGRITIGVFGKRCEVSNLAWVYMTGAWPSVDVDHKDRNPLNNRWDNLREATRSQNCMNQTVRVTSSTGLKGISPHKNGTYRARISAPGVRYDLGLFPTKEYAAAAYRIAAAGIHGEYSGV